MQRGIYFLVAAVSFKDSQCHKGKAGLISVLVTEGAARSQRTRKCSTILFEVQ
jgi:hypothetical protein